MKKFKLGPLYTPPSMQGTLQRPGVIGGANWGGAAFDPETQTLYVKTSNAPAVVRIHAFDRSPDNPRASEVDADFIGDVSGSTNFIPEGSGPLVKPPYGELVAINLNTGDVKWRATFGDTPSIRSHPALAGVPIPARLGASGVGGVIVTRGGLVIGAGGDSALYAFDTSTGKELASLDLGRRASSTPMTYRTKSGRQFVVIAAGQGNNAALMAFALPRGQISIF
jgi:quinoprotein glucose dehydrogenase